MTIEELQKKLVYWRKHKKSTKNRKIPEEYWEAAVKFANESTPSKVSTKLGLNCTDLKKRMGTTESSPVRRKRKKRSPQITLQEIPLQTSNSHHLFEIISPNGTTIRVYQ